MSDCGEEKGLETQPALLLPPRGMGAGLLGAAVLWLDRWRVLSRGAPKPQVARSGLAVMLVSGISTACLSNLTGAKRSYGIVVYAPEVGHTQDSGVSAWALSGRLGHAEGPQEQEAGNRCHIPRLVELDSAELCLSSSGDREERGFWQ